MLQHMPLRNLKFRSVTTSLSAALGLIIMGLWILILHAPGCKARPREGLNCRPCFPSQKNVDQQRDRQNQSYSEMNPTCPRTQLFAAQVIKAVAGDGQNGERTQKTDPFTRLRRARHANLTCPVKSMPISTKIAIAAAPWIFLAQVFALVSKSPGDAAR